MLHFQADLVHHDPCGGVFLQNQLHDRITVAAIAEELEMNASYLSTLFAKETGTSVSSYIRSRKLLAAKHLLTYESYSCTDIAEYLGFSHESHFSALFAKEEGITPKQYRKKQYQRHFEEAYQK